MPGRCAGRVRQRDYLDIDTIDTLLKFFSDHINQFIYRQVLRYSQFTDRDYQPGL